MSQVQRSSLQSLHRTHSFINRTPHTVLNIVGKKNCHDIITKMESTIMAKSTNQKLSALVNSSNVRCIRIDECSIQNNQQFMQVPSIVARGLFTNLLKLAITKCNLQTINMKVETSNKKQKQPECIFPNLEQIEISDNKLRQIPTFIYESRKLKKIIMNKNNVNKLDDELKQLQNLKYIGIFENNIGYLSVNLLMWARQSGLVIDYEWKLDFLSLSINKLGQQEKTEINKTQGEEIQIAAEEQPGSAHSYRDRLGQYLEIGQVLKYLIKRANQKSLEMKIQKDIEIQYLQLLSYEHIEYMKHFQQYVIRKGSEILIKYIQRCLKQRYYKSMDYLLNLMNVFQEGEQKKGKLSIQIEYRDDRKQKQNVIVVGKKRIKMLTKNQNKCRNKIISLQSPTSFYEITNNSNLTERSYKTNNIVQLTKQQFKRNGRQDKNKKVKEDRNRDKARKSKIQITQYQQESSMGKSGQDQIPSAQQSIQNPNRIKLKSESPFKTNGFSTILSPIQQRENCLWMAKLVSYNISHIQSIPLSVLLQINLNQFTWFLNQLQYVYKYLIKNNSKPNAHINTIYLKSIFKSKPIAQMSNNLITNENLLQYILNSVSYKLAIKLLLTSSSLEFLSHYNFSSPSIIKSILLFDDYQLFSFFVNSYKNFATVIFGGFSNRYFHQCQKNNVSITNSITLENEMSRKKVQNDNKYSKWQQIVRPHSKLYKILYKKQKQHIRKHIKENNSKNWHFPQYIQPQTFIVRNDVYDYEVLKDYEQFQSSFLYKDLKLQIRSNVTNKQKYNHFSIAKKIYMDVVQQMNGLIRNLGKSKNKSNKKSSVYHNNNKSDVYSAEAWINSNKKNGTLSASLLPNNVTEGKLYNISINISTDLNKTLKTNQSKSISNSQFFTNTRSYKKQQYATKQNIRIEKDIHSQLESKKSSIRVLSKREKQNDNIQSGEQDLKSFQIRERKKKGINVMRNSELNSCSKSQCLRRSQIQLTPYQKILRDNIKQLQLTEKRTIYLDLKSNSKNNEKFKDSFNNLSKTDRLNQFRLSQQECQIFNSQEVQCSTFDIT